jgi:hypothetical protein
MTFAIIGIRNERDFKLAFGPGPVDEVAKEFKDRVAKDLGEEGDGTVHGVMELFELRTSNRSHKIRGALQEAKGKQKRGGGVEEEDENSHGKARKKATHE